MENTDRRTRARGAIQQLAVGLGLPQDLSILSERWNTVVRLGDSGIIAKAATLADLVIANPQWSFMIEVEVCRHLHSHRAPVHEPFEDGFYEVNGLPITLWHEVAGEMGEATENDLVGSLAEIHRIGADLLKDQDWFSTITTHFRDVFPKLRERNVIEITMLVRLEDHYHQLMENIVASKLANGFIHGDAQRKNAIAIETGAVWIDFEECSFGPVAWDLACLSMNRRFDMDRVLDQYAEITGSSRMANAHIEVLQQLRDLEGLTWMLAIQHEREPSFADEAANLLTEVLNTAIGD